MSKEFLGGEGSGQRGRLRLGDVCSVTVVHVEDRGSAFLHVDALHLGTVPVAVHKLGSTQVAWAQKLAFVITAQPRRTNLNAFTSLGLESTAQRGVGDELGPQVSHHLLQVFAILHVLSVDFGLGSDLGDDGADVVDLPVGL